jgi:BirA family biotin operon repressor/biotin-[acetyl-CoA-carboxylase] ligase
MIRTVAETGSTNDDMAALARAGAAEGLWLRAERQTGGRGRQGRGWHSPAGNLYASTLVRLRQGDPTAPTLALVAAVALHETAETWLINSPPGLPGGAGGGPSSARSSLRSLPPMSRSPCPPDRVADVRGTSAPAHPLPEAREGKVMIKWPNDLVAGDAKLAGILLERFEEAVVIGFGANLACHPQGLDRLATDLAALAGAAPDPAAFLEMLAERFGRWLARWRAQGVAPLRARWLKAAHPIGTALSTAQGEGLFDGLDETGALRLRLADGSSRVIHAGDVFLI